MIKAIYLITPFKNDKEIDYKKLEELIKIQIDNDINEIIFCSEVGDSNTLSFEEKKSIIEYALKFNDLIDISFYIDERNLDNAIELLSISEEIDRIVLSTKSINTNTEGMYQYINTLLNKTKVPILLEVDKEIDDSLYIRLLYHTSLEGLVIHNTNSDFNTKVKNQFPLSKIYLSSDILDDNILEIDGFISTIANIHPRFQQLGLTGLINALALEPIPIMIKEAMNLIGLEVGPFRFPYYQTNNQKKEALIKGLVDLI